MIEHFEVHQPAHLDADLDETRRATAFFARELMEERLYWQVTYMRWGDPTGWRVFKPGLTPYLPKAMRGPGLFAIRRTLLRRMRQKGLSPKNPIAAYSRGMPMRLCYREPGEYGQEDNTTRHWPLPASPHPGRCALCSAAAGSSGQPAAN